MKRYHLDRLTLHFVLLTLSVGCTPDKLTESDYLDSFDDSHVSDADDDTGPGFRPQNNVDAVYETDTPETDSQSSADITVPNDVSDDLDTADIPADPQDSSEDAVKEDTPSSDAQACIPDCVNKECGADGCGGICGICSAGAQCNDLYLCAAECDKQCEGKFCGPDGCGGTCGSCESGFECGPDGKCYNVTCVPDCLDKVCGDDGCNGSCGECVFGDVCSTGQCIAGPCSGISEGTGDCIGETLVACVDGKKVEENCAAIPGYTCDWNPNVSKYQCLQTGSCLPNCVAKECGGDGCGGFCGICPDGWPCQANQCTPVEGGECGYFNSIGTCQIDTLYYCDSDTLFIEDCTDFGQKCGFDPVSQTNQCSDP